MNIYSSVVFYNNLNILCLCKTGSEHWKHDVFYQYEESMTEPTVSVKRGEILLVQLNAEWTLPEDKHQTARTPAGSSVHCIVGVWRRRVAVVTRVRTSATAPRHRVVRPSLCPSRRPGRAAGTFPGCSRWRCRWLCPAAGEGEEEEVWLSILHSNFRIKVTHCFSLGPSDC